MPRVKRLAAPHLSNSWNTIPHVTHHDEADITELEDFRAKLTDPVSGDKMKITPLAFIAKALTNNLKKFPTFNSSIDNISEGKITLKKYIHIGIAVDTPHGLMVPKIRDVDKKDITIVVGYKKELIMNEFPDCTFIFNHNYEKTNTAKSLLCALSDKFDADIIWINGDVVFDQKAIKFALEF